MVFLNFFSKCFLGIPVVLRRSVLPRVNGGSNYRRLNSAEKIFRSAKTVALPEISHFLRPPEAKAFTIHEAPQVPRQAP